MTSRHNTYKGVVQVSYKGNEYVSDIGKYVPQKTSSYSYPQWASSSSSTAKNDFFYGNNRPGFTNCDSCGIKISSVEDCKNHFNVCESQSAKCKWCDFSGNYKARWAHLLQYHLANVTDNLKTINLSLNYYYQTCPKCAYSGAGLNYKFHTCN